jgi:hypothetical protein
MAKILSQETKDKIRKAMLGKPKSIESRRKLSESRKGMVFSKEHRENLSKVHKERGTVPPSQKGKIPWNYEGKTPLNEQIRKSFEYRQWRSDVFTRDDFICQNCGQRGKELNAHHKKEFCKIMEKYNVNTFEDALKCAELWNINNGQTLCKDCHQKIGHKYKE